MHTGNKIWLILLILPLLLVFCSAIPVQALTEEIEAKQQELEEIEKKRHSEKNALEQRLNRETALEEELLELENRIRELRLEQEELACEIAAVEKEIEEAEAELAEAEEQLSYQEELLKLRMRAIQQHGFVSYIEVLFESNSFFDFLTRLHNLSIIATNDLRLVEEYQAEKEKIESWKEELELKKADLEAMRRRVADNEAELERAVGERASILKQLEEEIALNLKAIADLENEAQQLDALIRKLIAEASNQFSGLNGKLLWPIEPPTWVSSGYGWRNDPFSGAKAWHGGIDIAPNHGAANYILAAADGQVIYAGWNGGYGNCLMVDHGGGTVTLYAHMSSLLVNKGDVVLRGERIARAGTTGYSTGVHLHFEVREYEKSPVRSYPSGNPDYRHNPTGYF